MGISVVSSAKLATGGNAASALQPAADSGNGGFSALLGVQLAVPPLPGLQLAASPTAPIDKGSANDDGPAQDPAGLLAAAGLLPTLLAGASQNPVRPAPPAATGTATDAVPAPTTDPIGRALLANARPAAGTAADPGAPALKAGLPGSPNAGETLAEAAIIAADAGPNANAAPDFAAALAAQAAAANRLQAQNESAAAAPQVSVPVQDSRWAQDFSDKVVWLAKNDQQTAQIALNPPQLGPVHITLNLSGDQATAVFASPHAEVRQAIADAIPQLREMLAGAGIDLGQANVGAQLPGQNGQTPQQFSDSRRFDGDGAILRNDSGQAVPTVPQPLRSGRGMVDLFA